MVCLVVMPEAYGNDGEEPRRAEKEGRDDRDGRRESHGDRHGKKRHGKGLSVVWGRVSTSEKEVIDYGVVYLKGTEYSGNTDENGFYQISVPAGEYEVIVSAVGYRKGEKKVKVGKHGRERVDFTLKSENVQLDEVTVVSTGVSRVKRSAYNAVAVDTKELQNTTKTLGDALDKVPGVKLRESGGVGSDMQLTLDGFSGKHVKVFIDGVPQEGVGSSFGLNNIPVNYAERIEVYKGVVPVGFGTDAIGGVVNIVTKKGQKEKKWFLDASYSYGSFNTHKSYVNFGQTLDNGFTYEINAFQNYSDNDYYVDAPVKDFETGRIDVSKLQHVKRFNDTYHNEAVVAKVGVAGKKWADRLLFGFTFANMYKDIQTGVRQKTVFGEKHRNGYSLMPSLEYGKRNLLLRGLDAVATVNYNRDITTNVDTSRYEYNWLGERNPLNSPGEQSRQYLRSHNDNWNATVTLNYRISKVHHFSFNNVFNAFRRSNTSLLTAVEQTDPIAKQTRKNITGLSYRLMPSDKWNLSVFGKYYHLYVAGPMATDETSSSYVRHSRSMGSFGYGAAGTYFILPELQAKLSYEKAYRLPTIEETFGDEDLETGDISIRPENSDNLNFNLSYNRTFGKHSVYVEGGLVYRNTKDYIQRQVVSLSGNREAAAYTNYGKVLTKGYNISARYGFSRWLSVGGSFTQMDVTDNEKYQIGSTGNSVANLGYKSRMPNVPYRFSDMDVTFSWHGLFAKGNVLTVTYDNRYLHSFSYLSEIIGSSNDEFMVPDQFSHNIMVGYSIKNGRYNLSFECRNIFDEKLYDNFSLQKAGRAFYGKLRIYLGN